ncbi:MAG: DUF6062 family protein [Clostridia bacterium]|nr:ABC transporter substrate-binding protein [Clostridiales bacterium]MCR5804843.1 DUF6062 family protein [Clostridia bacterium]
MEKIYTIPVNDAYNEPTICPLCFLKNKAESDYLDYYLGPSLMEPDTRKITNKSGFCPDHMGKLNKREANRLGLGLMLHTHLIDIKSDIAPQLQKTAPGKGNLLKGRNTEYKSNLKKLADKIDSRVKACPICEKLDYTMDRYSSVICWMFSHDKDFKEKFANCKTYCLPHISALLRACADNMSQNDAADFLPLLSSGVDSSLTELISDVEWFTLKFDYRNNDKPWGNSKNAIQRSMRILSSDRSDFDEKQGKAKQ